ncbi:MAG: hypothetical protein LBC98_04150 [Prevotellaceae bacterium]|jgi:hypothetical protein|nr:hypothetical protein [Prevotellaceae bacterium]
MKKTEQAMLKALIVSNLIFAPLFMFGQSRYVLIDSLFVNDTVRVNEVNMKSTEYNAYFSIFNLMFIYPVKYFGHKNLYRPKTKYLISITAYPDFEKGKTEWEMVNLEEIDKSKIINYRDLEKEIVPRLRNYDTMMNDSVLTDCDLALIVKREDGYSVSKSGTCAEFYEIRKKHPVYVYPGAGRFYELNTSYPFHFIEDYHLNIKRNGLKQQTLQLMFLSETDGTQRGWFDNATRYKFWSLDRQLRIKVLEYDKLIGIIGSTIGYKLVPRPEVSDIDSKMLKINNMSAEEYYKSLGTVAEYFE